MVVDEEVVVEEELEELEELIVDEEEDAAAGVRVYRDKRLPAPHISLEFPAHVIEQSFALVFTLPA